jgi:diguanylate cyclase (GGDEF)-like protein
MRMPPGWDGLRTIQELWKADANLQVVLCTAYSDEALERVTYTLGHASKLLVLKKPFEPIEVQQIAAALCEKWRAEREAELKVEELESIVRDRTREAEHAALHDKLTSLPNRALMMERLDSCLDNARREVSRRFALLFIDVDGFKGVNDALGHGAGDQLLVRIAERIQAALRARDLIAPGFTPARLGGDEFLVLIEGLTRASDAARIAERLVADLSAPYEIGSHRLSVGVSIGLATSDRPYASASDMLRDADIAMYRAKRRGGARYMLFDEEMHREIAARLRLEAALRRAVAEDALSLHYQPIVHIATGRIEGLEALARWRDAELGDVSASDLITAAEETGAIQQLGLQLLRRACRQLAAWHAACPNARDMRMMVNLSRRQLVDSEFSSRVADVIAESGVDPTKIGLEITETSVLHDVDGAIAALRRLRGLGASVLLDDFGSGYSAISYLDRMPLSGMKIERSFVTRALSDPRHTAMLEAMVRMARAFALDIVAEGIETRAELALVQSLGIERAQGWLWARAVPATEAGAMIRAGRLDPLA